MTLQTQHDQLGRPDTSGHPGHPNNPSNPSNPSNVVPLRAPVPIAATQGTLALDLEPILEPPVALLPSAPRHESDHDVHGWVIRYAQAAVEIVSGDRPASQLVRWTARSVHLDLERRALLVARAGGHQPGAARVSPIRARVLSAHVGRPIDGVAEAAVHIRYGERSRALAARFERRSGRWVCTALEFA